MIPSVDLIETALAALTVNGRDPDTLARFQADCAEEVRAFRLLGNRTIPVFGVLTDMETGYLIGLETARAAIKAGVML